MCRFSPLSWITTGFIAEEFPEGFKGVVAGEQDQLDLAAIATFIHVHQEKRASEISGVMANHQRHIATHWQATVSGVHHAVEAMPDGEGLRITVAGHKPQSVTSDWTPGQTLARFHVGVRSLSIKAQRHGTGLRLRRRGMDVVVHVRSPRAAELAKLMPLKVAQDTSKLLLCPMPGLLRQLSVKVGDNVEAGQALAVVEAMKMENVLRAEKQAVVKKVTAQVGDSLAVEQLILEFE
jgi:propionyl-CoA carboxylase alpha chain